MLSKKQWLMLTIGWFILTPGVFFLSERFMDIEIILYPSVLLLLVSMIFGFDAIAIHAQVESGSEVGGVSYIFCLLCLYLAVRSFLFYDELVLNRIPFIFRRIPYSAFQSPVS